MEYQFIVKAWNYKTKIARCGVFKTHQEVMNFLMEESYHDSIVNGEMGERVYGTWNEKFSPESQMDAGEKWLGDHVVTGRD